MEPCQKKLWNGWRKKHQCTWMLAHPICAKEYSNSKKSQKSLDRVHYKLSCFQKLNHYVVDGGGRASFFSYASAFPNPSLKSSLSCAIGLRHLELISVLDQIWCDRMVINMLGSCTCGRRVRKSNLIGGVHSAPHMLCRVCSARLHTHSMERWRCSVFGMPHMVSVMAIVGKGNA
jgi:hypothetical protein